jgi:NADPH-dependent 2,4-dienoyl-CoA reductase/sulfur reductase-like enzyme
MGTGPLLYLAAYQYAKAGAKVAAVLDTSPASLRFKAVPQLLAQPATLMKGVYYMAALMARGVRIETGVAPVAIQGTDGVSQVRFTDSAGEEQLLACDAVALGYHLRPETQLADLARCEFDFDANMRQWIPRADDSGRSTTPGVYLAGDGARALGADAAEIGGALAAHALLEDQGRAQPGAVVEELKAAKARIVRFQSGIARSFPLPVHLLSAAPDDTLVCRCEAITAGELRRTVHELGAPEVNRAKALSRVGMGRCQGRFCGIAAAEIIAAELRISPEQVGRIRGQGPVKPLALDTIGEEAKA